ncbi:MAG: ABC transporter ATP-binding protein [Candidatus Omnitrophica bacterium]|nr:ABC transporter ATP-binding protein [Candidatus Omnitrophota bacterium]
MNNLLEIKNLEIEFRGPKKRIPAVEGISLAVRKNEIVGIVGESGSGKTVTTLAITRILPSTAQVTRGEIFFEGNDLLKMPEEELRHIRGTKIVYIFQEATMYLNPLLTVGAQVAETILLHFRCSQKEAKHKAQELLRKVCLPRPEEIMLDYPHQLSGGMNQRIMIAHVLCSTPQLLIADEPTANLDLDTEEEILNLIFNLQKELGFSCIFISHNLGLIKRLCQRVYVMYRGKIVEEGALSEIFAQPIHPHTQALVNAHLRLTE